MKLIHFTILIIFTSCAAHAPMSELVMFEKNIESDSLDTNRRTKGVSVMYFEPGISGNDFEEFRPGDYASYTDGEVPSITLQSYSSTGYGKARSFSIGRGLGVDWTNKLYSDYYGTLALSFPHSAKLTVQRPIINRSGLAISTGLFSGIDSRRYYSLSDEENDGFVWFPDQSVFLFNSGIKTRILIRNPQKSSIGLTGALETGYIWAAGHPFIGVNFSVITFY
ncbi:MAG: hypothetical protein ED557_08805 [Balneola sp.]|nr:MAG: hypothetical protein ED557_08805 [Balneola sp.]